MSKKVKIQIKSYWGKLLFEWESEDNTIKETLSRAVLSDAVLRGAVLRGADLRGADLSRAVLSDAVLSDADLRGADLSDADLRGADLSRAVLSDAVLRGADLRGADPAQLGDYTNQCSRDMLFIFDKLKPELPGLRKALIEGRIDGTQYEGDCACLIGTLGKLDGGIENVCQVIPLYEKGLNNFGEQWFYQIRKGDTPKNNKFAAHVITLIDMVDPPKKTKARKATK